jgi:hypothetical protein
MAELPRFKGYTIDYRLGEFRRMQPDPDGVMECIPFDRYVGQQLLYEHIIQLYDELLAANHALIPYFMDEFGPLS